MKPGTRMIQFGSGTNQLSTPWENYDMDVDITRVPLPFPDGCAKKILIEHCLEHVSGPQGFRFLQDAFRMLTPGGVLRVCVPELTRLDTKSRIDIIVNHGHQVVFCFETLKQLLETAGFTDVRVTPRDPIDGHHKVIGIEKDDLETLRVEAIRP